MKDLSLTQEYLLCALNEKGAIPSFSTEKRTCLIAAALMELQMENCISLQGKKAVAVRPLPEERGYLRPLYDFVAAATSCQTERILREFTFSFSDRHINDLIAAVGRSLETLGCASASEQGLLRKKEVYLPQREAVNMVIDKVRAELLEDGEVTEDAAAIAVLLDKAKMLQFYFSKFEQQELKERLAQLAHSAHGAAVQEMLDYVDGLMAMVAILTVTVGATN